MPFLCWCQLLHSLLTEEGCLLVGLEEEAVVAVVYNWRAFILSCFGGRELDMGEHPGLPVIRRELLTLTLLLGLTFETHWSSRSIRVGLQAPAARTTLSA